MFSVFLAFRGLFRVGYILGLVTILYGLGFLGLRVILLQFLAKLYYGWVVFTVFLCLDVFSVRVYLRVSYGCLGLRFFRV